MMRLSLPVPSLGDALWGELGTLRRHRALVACCCSGQADNGRNTWAARVRGLWAWGAARGILELGHSWPGVQQRDLKSRALKNLWELTDR